MSANAPESPETPAPEDPSLTAARAPGPLLELGVVLLFGVFPHLTSALIPVLFDPAAFDGVSEMPFAFESIIHIASSAGIIAVILWIIRQADEPWQFFGFVKPRLVTDSISGVGLYCLQWIVYMGFGTILATALYNIGIDLYDTDPFESGMLARPTHPLDTPMIIVMSVANASAEQLVITAYLIPRLAAIFRNHFFALVLSTALFASYHIYQGVWGVINAACFGLLFGGFFCLRKRIWPCIVAHCFGDIVPYTLAYLDA